MIQYTFPTRRLPKRASRATRLEFAVAQLNVVHDAIDMLIHQITKYHIGLHAIREDFSVDVEPIVLQLAVLYVDSQAEIRALQEEVSEWRQDMEPHFSHTDKYSTLGRIAVALEEAYNELSVVDEKVFALTSYRPGYGVKDLIERLGSTSQAIADLASSIECAAELPIASGE